MPLPDNDRSRPAANGPASNVIADDSTDIVVRCVCCGRVLRAPLSVRLEKGPVCRVVA